MSREIGAVRMTGPGGPGVLKPGRVALPWPAGPRDVLVRLKAAGVNPADVYFRAFGPYVGDGRNVILGHDGAGIVEEIGAEVSGVRVGDAVCFCHGGIGGAPGTYSEYAVVPEPLLVAKPENVDFREAAALPLVFITIHESLSERARVADGDRVLIHAGAGGTGHIGVQVARLLGGRVAATVSTRAKAEFVSGLGVERPILYRDEDFVEACREWTGGRGLDVALDNVGEDVFRRTLKAMSTYGRVVTLIGTPGDTKEEDAYNGNLSLYNVMMLTPMWRGLSARMSEQAAMVRQGMSWLAQGRIRIHVDRTFPLERAAEAHAHIEAGGATGKIVLTIDD